MSKTLNEKQQLIRDALAYRSGPDRCNAIYLGGMATAAVYRAIRAEYGKPETFEPALIAASHKQLDNALKNCKGVIKAMRKYPMRICKSCGQVVNVRR